MKFIAILLLAFPAWAAPVGVTLEWEPSLSPGVAAYRVYIDGHAAFDTGPNVRAVEIRGLVKGQTYAFFITAVDAEGIESDPSNTAQGVADHPPKKAEAKTLSIGRLIIAP